jgi:RNA polymerase sigma-70 factor (ECF subfamily)
MIDAGDRGEDPGDADTDHMSLEEVRAELARLSTPEAAPEWRKIELKARILVRGTTLDWRDLVNTVVAGLLAPESERRRRRWHRLERFPACFDRTMKSIVRDHWRREQSPIVPINEAAAGQGEASDPEKKAAARMELDALLNALDDHRDTWKVAWLRAQGYSPVEIKRLLNLTDTDYDTALKRIRREVLRRKAAGGQS